MKTSVYFLKTSNILKTSFNLSQVMLRGLTVSLDCVNTFLIKVFNLRHFPEYICVVFSLSGFCNFSQPCFL